MVQRNAEEDDNVRPCCFSPISNCEDGQGRRFRPLQNTYETVPQGDTSRRVDRYGQVQIRNAETGKWDNQGRPSDSTFDHKRCAKIFLPILVLLLGVVIVGIWLARGGDNSTFPESSEDSVLNSHIRSSILWRKENREHVGIWLGCYRRLCGKTFSERDYDAQFLDKILSTLQIQFSTVVLNPPRPSIDHFPPENSTDSESLDNIRIPSLFATRALNHPSLPISTVLTFDNVTNFESILYMANAANDLRTGSVSTLIFKGGRSLLQNSLLDDLDSLLLTLLTIRNTYLAPAKNVHKYKLGLLIDRNDCVKWGGGGGDEDLILAQVDVIMYRTQHDYYKYTSPRTDGNRRVPDAERQGKAADPLPYHLQMIHDLRKCEKVVQRSSIKEIEFLPVVNCDKYWWQTYINIIVHEHKNLENLVKCWQLAGDWAKRNDRKVVLLMDREIEKHGWFSLA